MWMCYACFDYNDTICVKCRVTAVTQISQFFLFIHCEFFIFFLFFMNGTTHFSIFIAQDRAVPYLPRVCACMLLLNRLGANKSRCRSLTADSKWSKNVNILFLTFVHVLITMVWIFTLILFEESTRAPNSHLYIHICLFDGASHEQCGANVTGMVQYLWSVA